MSEEEKKANEIEDIEVLECELNFRPINSSYDKKILRAIFRMLNKVKKQQKEIEELKEKNKELEEKIGYTAKYVEDNYINKSKVRRKLNELNNSDFLEDVIAIPYIRELLED